MVFGLLMLGLRFFAMDNGNFAGYGLLVLCMISDSLLWTEVILLCWWFVCAIHGLRFCAMGRGNFVGVGGLLVLCMVSDSLLWTEVIVLWLVVFLCYAWAQILCYGQT